MFFDKQIFEVIPNVKKNTNGRENWANAGEGNKELDMLPRQVLATHRTPCRRFRIRLRLRLSRRSSPFCKAPSSRFDFQIFDFCLYGQVPVSLHSHPFLPWRTVRVTAKALARRSRLRLGAARPSLSIPFYHLLPACLLLDRSCFVLFGFLACACVRCCSRPMVWAI